MRNLPPRNIEAEQAILGSILIDPRMIERVINLSPSDFYYTGHRLLWQVLLDLYKEKTPIDIVILSEAIERRGIAEKIRIKTTSGTAYLAELTCAVPTSIHAVHYAKIVMELAIRRQLIEISGKIAGLAYGQESDLETVLSSSERMIVGVRRGLPARSISVGDALKEYMAQLQEHWKNPGAVQGISWGWHNMNRAIDGIQPGVLVVLGGRPGEGKTTIAMNVAYTVAVEFGIPVQMYSLDMQRSKLVPKFLAMGTHFNTKKIRRGEMSTQEMELFEHVQQKLREAPLHIDDSRSYNINQLMAVARRTAIEQGHPALVIVDYVQLLKGSGRDIGIREKVVEVTGGLRCLAGPDDLDCCVLALSQMNRGIEYRPGKKPVMSDLKESGSLEEDGDIVMFTQRKDGGENGQPMKIDLTVAKNRDGAPGGKIKLLLFGAQARMVDRTEEDDMPI